MSCTAFRSRHAALNDRAVGGRAQLTVVDRGS